MSNSFPLPDTLPHPKLRSQAPVQKWQTANLVSAQVDKDKPKHILVEIGGPNSASLHFNAGSRDTADAIVKKLETSKQLSAPPPEGLQEPVTPPERPRSAGKSVHFNSAPAIIPDQGESDEEWADTDYDPNAAVVLYDFTADGDDELTVAEGEDLIVLERDSDDWWKVRSSKGREGVVPASYVEVRSLLSSANISIESVPSCGIRLLRTTLSASHKKQSKKPKPRRRLRKRGAGEKKRKRKRRRRRSGPRKRLNVPKPWPLPTRNAGTRKRLRGRRERRDWLLKRKRRRNHNRTCALSLRLSQG